VPAKGASSSRQQAKKQRQQQVVQKGEVASKHSFARHWLCYMQLCFVG
jgi:hypothetical protein